MAVRIHPHAAARMEERGALFAEVAATVEAGESYPARHGRSGFRRNLQFDGIRGGKRYRTKQIDVFAIQENDEWLVIAVIVKYF